MSSQNATFRYEGGNEGKHPNVREVLGINRKYSVEASAKAPPYKHEGDRDLMADALRKEGLK
jgi:hypothetical protein